MPGEEQPSLPEPRLSVRPLGRGPLSTAQGLLLLQYQDHSNPATKRKKKTTTNQQVSRQHMLFCNALPAIKHLQKPPKTKEAPWMGKKKGRGKKQFSNFIFFSSHAMQLLPALIPDTSGLASWRRTNTIPSRDLPPAEQRSLIIPQSSICLSLSFT